MAINSTIYGETIMFISTSCFVKKYCLFILFLFLVSTTASAQKWRYGGWAYIQNVKTGLVIDVQGNVKANGRNVWPYSLNYGKAQMFQFSDRNIPERYGEDARYITAYNNSQFGSPFYLSVKIPRKAKVPIVNVRPGTFSVLVPPTTVGVVDTDRPKSNKKTLRNFAFSIEAKREIDDSPISRINDHSISSTEVPKQIWKLLPVPCRPGQRCTPDTYYIQNAHFRDKMVIEPLDFRSGGKLVLSSFTGSSIQKWRILKTRPPKPTNLKLSNFRWEERLNQTPYYKPWKWHREQKIKGKLSWTNLNASGLKYQYFSIRDEGVYGITLEPNKTSYEFNIKSSKSARTKEHCFFVRAYSKWQAENWVNSEYLCEKPGFEESRSKELKFTYYLEAQVVNEGVRPYLFHWNPGTPNNAYIKSIRISKGAGFPSYIVHLMKKGQSMEGCGTASASVTLEQGQTTTAVQLKTIFGTSKPRPVVSILACITQARPNQRIDKIPILITYVRE